MADTAKVEGHAHLVRDLKSQAIVNTDSDAYARYMARKRAQKHKNDELREVIRDVNELKIEMREIKDCIDWNKQFISSTYKRYERNCSGSLKYYG